MSKKAIVAMLALLLTVQQAVAGYPGDFSARDLLRRAGTSKGMCILVEPDRADLPVELARQSQLLIYVQSSDAGKTLAIRLAAGEAGMLGRRIFVSQSPTSRIPLAGNLADVIFADGVSDKELLRVLRPGGKALLPEGQIVKPVPEGADDWSHPYHGPDNNPQSADQLARAPYLTRFIAEPKFCPMPEVSVASGGRVFRAYGHIAHLANQNPLLNTLLCVNAYNGTVLWRRPLKEGFMIHRNTMIATADTLYLADDESCKLIDARTGKVTGEITVPDGISDGPVWKWMALQDGVLYALVGGKEVHADLKRARRRGLGGWPWGMWKGHDYADPVTNFGFGRTLLAIDPAGKKVLWTHREDDYIDSRGVCMAAGRIFLYSPQKFLAAIDAANGQTVWKAAAPDLLEAIGPDSQAQHYLTGYATTTYVKCNDKYVFFCGPQRPGFVAVSAETGKVVWQKEDGNHKIVLRDGLIYSAGEHRSTKIAQDTGEVLTEYVSRRACTRATGSADAVFFRAQGGTVRIDLASDVAQHISPMRPPCQTGVIIANGLLYWAPWMCACQLSMYGHISLGPAEAFDRQAASQQPRLESGPKAEQVEDFPIRPGDWPCYRGDNQRASVTSIAISQERKGKWTYQHPSLYFPTAPVTADGMAFVGDRGGVVHAVDSAEGNLRWRAYTGGAIIFPPAIWQGRAYVGSADGWVYAFEAATGRQLWRYRVAPAQRMIPVFGQLSSTWPVAGGVIVQDGVLYAAAGINSFDGTYVCALDAVTGKPIWRNDSSGMLSDKVKTGISLQGGLYLADGELRFDGGNVYATARYDLKTGRCLCEPHDKPSAESKTAFYAYYPEYGKFASLDHKLPDGRTLSYQTNHTGFAHANLALLEAAEPGSAEPAPGWRLRRLARDEGPKPIWQSRRYKCFAVAVAPDGVLLAGEDFVSDDASFLSAVNIDTGKRIWRVKLPAVPVKDGLATDHAGRIYTSLESGQLLCFTAE